MCVLCPGLMILGLDLPFVASCAASVRRIACWVAVQRVLKAHLAFLQGSTLCWSLLQHSRRRRLWLRFCTHYCTLTRELTWTACDLWCQVRHDRILCHLCWQCRLSFVLTVFWRLHFHSSHMGPRGSLGQAVVCSGISIGCIFTVVTWDQEGL